MKEKCKRQPLFFHLCTPFLITTQTTWFLAGCVMSTEKLSIWIWKKKIRNGHIHKCENSLLPWDLHSSVINKVALGWSKFQISSSFLFYSYKIKCRNFWQKRKFILKIRLLCVYFRRGKRSKKAIAPLITVIGVIYAVQLASNRYPT